MRVPGHDIAEVIRRFLPELRNRQGISCHQFKVLNALQRCRTSTLGGSVQVCSDCGVLHYVYHSCRNRHCPKCGGIERERWIMAREADLLPVKYFHVVFTIPDQLNQLCLHHPGPMYNLLFKTAWDVLGHFEQDDRWKGIQLGATAVLHTWSQQLQLHPHIHLIVPAGGITPGGKWQSSRNRGQFLFPVKNLSDVFRARYVAAIRKWAKQKQIRLDTQLMDGLFDKPWTVFAKQPFLGPKQVIEYLGRYTHKVAISNHRIKKVDDHTVLFTYKDRRDGDKTKELPLDGPEFLRRFLMHILPPGFTRIRHLGFLSPRSRKKALPIIRAQLKAKAPVLNKLTWQEIAKLKWGLDPGTCKHCNGKLVPYETLPRERAPPVAANKSREQCISDFYSVG